MILVILLLLSVVFIILSTAKYNIHPFLALIFAAIGFGLFSGMPLPDIVESINGGFGKVIGSIGIVIICGTIIGTFLERSGGAFAMAERVLRVIGEKHVPMAMGIIGYVVSVPVFADSGFIILSPLAKALSKKVKISLAGTAIALALGLTATHSLVPPTPGPIAAAGILEADLGLIVLFAIPISFLSFLIGWVFAVKYASKTYIDPNPELSEAEVSTRMKEGPSAYRAFLPILVPLLLIVLKSFSGFSTEGASDPKSPGFMMALIGFIGEPVIALLIGVILAFSLPKKLEMSMLSVSGWVGESLLSAAIIIMITGAGGSFGMILRNSGIADVIGDSLANANLGIWLPFIVTAAIKSAQGSSTVAIITAASLMAPLAESLGFGSSIGKAFLVLAIGAGGIVVCHANDSGFWVFTRFSGMDVKTGYRLVTVGTLIVGCSAAVMIWITSLFVL